jgi:hypothetical protein
MKQLIHLVFIWIILSDSNSLMSQINAQVIREIHDYKVELLKNKSDYTKVVVEIFDETSEGGEEIAFYDGDDLKAIELNYFGSTGKKTLTYYFKENLLLLAEEYHHTYNRPIYWNDEIAFEFGEPEQFDQSKTTVHGDRYYFKGEVLFFWENHEGISMDLSMGTNAIVGKGLLSHAYAMKEKLKQ